MPIFIPVDITEDAVKPVTQKLSGSYGPVGTDPEALQGWLLKFEEDRKRLRIGVENFSDWLANKSLPRMVYCEFSPDRA